MISKEVRKALSKVLPALEKYHVEVMAIGGLAVSSGRPTYKGKFLAQS
jgi:hypothetical protein